MDSRENYLDYVANHPGVKALGEHGLWDANGKVPSLENAVAEVAQHTGNVWTPVISLSRENAERLGYTDLKNWQELINASMAGLMIQNLSRELFAVADENGGKLKNRVILFCDELGTMPPFDILPLFSAGRSRRLMLVPIIQSVNQLVKNYGKEGASILMDNCQDVICGGFAPNSEAAETFQKLSAAARCSPAL